MFEMALFDVDGNLLLCREYENEMCASVAIALAEENEDYDHGHLVNLETGEVVAEFGYVGGECLTDEMCANGGKPSYDLN